MTTAPSEQGTAYSVLQASMMTYRDRGHIAEHVWDRDLNAAVFVVRELGRVEWVETGSSLATRKRDDFDAVVSEGADLWVLVPLAYMGIAHDRFRGRVSRIQPWWTTGTAVAFGRPETP
jgi:hypothetical protein